MPKAIDEDKIVVGEQEDKCCEKIFICPFASSEFSPEYSDDEINLQDIWKIIWEWRFLVLFTAALITGVASAYALLTPRNYNAKVNIYPSSNLGIEVLQSEIKSMTPDEDSAFLIMVQNLQDKFLLSKFWAESDVVKGLMSNHLSTSRVSKAWFKNNLTVNIPSSRRPKAEQMVSVSLIGYDPEIIEKLLKDYLTYIETCSSENILENSKLQLDEKKKVIEAKIDLLRKEAAKKVQQELAILAEQKNIAEKLKIMNMSENCSNKPKYAMGTKAIQAEIDAIQERKNNDLFVEGISEWNAKLEVLDNISFSDVKVLPARLSTVEVSSMGKSGLAVIIAAGVVLGLVMGIFFSFLINFVSTFRDKKNER